MTATTGPAATAARPNNTAAQTLTLFDLDHTLLGGDSDVLWCEFLIQRGVLDGAEFAPRNAEMERAYQAGTVSPHDFCSFYVATLAGHSPQHWQPLREQFMQAVIAPRIPATAQALVQAHLGAGEMVVLTTATNRFLTELTAAHLGIAHLIATECEQADGLFTGRIADTLNMREGKVVRLHNWLSERFLVFSEFNTRCYSDSINDLPLLEAVQHPVAVDPEPRLAAVAAARGWPVLKLHTSPR